VKTILPKLTPFNLPAPNKATASRAAVHTPPTKEGKDKADHFREQLRAVAQDVKPASPPGADDPEVAALPARLPADRTTELMDEIKARSKNRDGQSHDKLPQTAATDAQAQPQEWQTPDAALNAVVSRLDQAQARAARDDGAIPHITPQSAKSDQQDALPKLGDLPVTPAADGPSAQRFAVPVDVAATRIAPTLKVMVRDQETHFEPVVQLTQLQKIVDQMATDLVAAPAPASAAAAVGADLPPADKPLRMLTLQLDPPDLGAVTVKMRLAGDTMEVRLMADRPETAEMLRKERGDLTDLMQSAGYSFDIASIDHVRAAADASASNGAAQGQPDQKSSQQPQGGSQFSGSSAERQSSDAQGGARHNRQGHDQIEKSSERQPDEKRIVAGNGSAFYL
jgi:chemotaxis protein MotD